MTNLFCSNCAYYSASDTTSRLCCSVNPEKEVTWLGVVNHYANPEKKNAHNDCLDYTPNLRTVLRTKWRQLWTR